MNKFTITVLFHPKVTNNLKLEIYYVSKNQIRFLFKSHCINSIFSIKLFIPLSNYFDKIKKKKCFAAFCQLNFQQIEY